MFYINSVLWYSVLWLYSDTMIYIILYCWHHDNIDKYTGWWWLNHLFNHPEKIWVRQWEGYGRKIHSYGRKIRKYVWNHQPVQILCVIYCYIVLYTVICCYILLYTVIYCYILLYTVIYCYLLLYTVIYCCTLLYTVIYCYILLYTVIYWCIL